MRRLALSRCCVFLTTLALIATPASADEYAPLDGALVDAVPADTHIDAGSHPSLGAPQQPAPDEAVAAFRERRDGWPAAARAVADRHPGTQMAADLYFGIAAHHASFGARPDRKAFSAASTRALDAYRAHDAARPALWILLARDALFVGDTPRATQLMQALDAWRDTVASWTPQSPIGVRERALHLEWQRSYGRLRARWLTATGKLDEAAAQYRRIAEEGLRAGTHSAWRDAREAYARAGNRDEALRAWQSGYDALEDDGQRARALKWRLYFDHELLDARGRPADIMTAKGWSQDPGWAESIRVLLGRLAHMRDVVGTYLELGGYAFLRNDPRLALEIMTRAMDRPDVAGELNRARMDASPLLAAFFAALDLARFDDAERLLETIARIQQLDPALMDSAEAMFRSRRADHARAIELRLKWAEEVKRRKAEAARESSADPRMPERGRLAIEADAAPESQSAPAPETDGRIPIGLGLVVLLGLIATLWISRRR